MRFGPGLWPGPRRQARWAGRGSRVNGARPASPRAGTGSRAFPGGLLPLSACSPGARRSRPGATHWCAVGGDVERRGAAKKRPVPASPLSDRLWLYLGRSFDIPLEYGQHAGLHRPDYGDIEPVVDGAFKPSRTEGLVTADDKTCAPARQLTQQEAPEPFRVGGWPWLLRVELAASQISQPAQSQEPIRFKRCHLPSVHGASPCPVLHVVTEGEVLPLRVDFCGTWATAVVEAVPGVPTPTVTAHLDQPWPDLIRRRVDRDGHRCRPLAVGDQLGTGIRPGNFFIACAPAHELRAHPACIDDCCRPGHTRDLASECHGDERPRL